MQTPTPQAQPGQGGISISAPGAPGLPPIPIAVPRTARDIEALKNRREELSTQLQSVDGRRSKLMKELKQTGDPTAIKGLEARLAQLDSRQLQLESALDQTGQQLSSPAAGLIAGTSAAPAFGGFSNKEVVTVSIFSIVFVLFPLAIGVAKSMFRRANRPGPPPGVFTETAQRLERLESSVDAIALEVERISEGQRFVTKLLSEGQPAPMLGAGQRTPEIVRGGS
jgi:hypothetical protein